MQYWKIALGIGLGIGLEIGLGIGFEIGYGSTFCHCSLEPPSAPDDVSAPAPVMTSQRNTNQPLHTTYMTTQNFITIKSIYFISDGFTKGKGA